MHPYDHKPATLAGLGVLEVVLGDPDERVQRWAHRAEQAALKVSGERLGNGDADKVA